MSGMVPNPGQPLDHHRHPGQRPMIGGKTMRPGPLPQRRLHSPELPRVQARLAPGVRGCFETGRAGVLPLPVPAGHAHPADVEPPADVRLGDAPLREQTCGLSAPKFKGVTAAGRNPGHSHTP